VDQARLSQPATTRPTRWPEGFDLSPLGLPSAPFCQPVWLSTFCTAEPAWDGIWPRLLDARVPSQWCRSCAEPFSKTSPLWAGETCGGSVLPDLMARCRFRDTELEGFATSGGADLREPIWARLAGIKGAVFSEAAGDRGMAPPSLLTRSKPGKTGLLGIPLARGRQPRQAFSTP